MEIAEIGSGVDSSEGRLRAYHLFYPVANRRFVGFFEGRRLGAGDKLVANIPFGGMSDNDIVDVLDECRCKGNSETQINVIRIATEEDLRLFRENSEKEEDCMRRASRIIESVGVKMNLINAHLMPFSKMIVLFFSSPSRVDFRPLLAPLGKEFKMSINLQQMSFKAEARNSDCYGICGRKLCCRSISNVVDRSCVTLKKVKEQKESLNSAKMQGPCGKFFCCFAFEEEFYKSQKKNFPSKGDRIVTAPNESFRVVDMNFISQIVKAENEEKGVRSFKRDEIMKSGNGEWRIIAGLV